MLPWRVVRVEEPRGGAPAAGEFSMMVIRDAAEASPLASGDAEHAARPSMARLMEVFHDDIIANDRVGVASVVTADVASPFVPGASGGYGASGVMDVRPAMGMVAVAGTSGRQWLPLDVRWRCAAWPAKVLRALGVDGAVCHAELCAGDLPQRGVRGFAPLVLRVWPGRGKWRCVRDAAVAAGLVVAGAEAAPGSWLMTISSSVAQPASFESVATVERLCDIVAGRVVPLREAGASGSGDTGRWSFLDAEAVGAPALAADRIWRVAIEPGDVSWRPALQWFRYRGCLVRIEAVVARADAAAEAAVHGANGGRGDSGGGVGSGSSAGGASAGVGSFRAFAPASVRRRAYPAPGAVLSRRPVPADGGCVTPVPGVPTGCSGRLSVPAAVAVRSGGMVAVTPTVRAEQGVAPPLCAVLAVQWTAPGVRDLREGRAYVVFWAHYPCPTSGPFLRRMSRGIFHRQTQRVWPSRRLGTRTWAPCSRRPRGCRYGPGPWVGARVVTMQWPAAGSWGCLTRGVRRRHRRIIFRVPCTGRLPIGPLLRCGWRPRGFVVAIPRLRWQPWQPHRFLEVAMPAAIKLRLRR